MKAARWYGAHDVRVEDVPKPEAKPGELLVRVEYAGLCASDIHEYSHGPLIIPKAPHPMTGRCAPIILGHEFSGTVEVVGSGVTAFRPGDRIVSETAIPCGQCPACKRGERILCEQGAYFGFAYDGSFAEHCTVPAIGCHKIPEKVSTFDAVIVEPLSVGLHGVRRGRMAPGDSVAVVGCGTIGLCSLLAARAGGARLLIAIDKLAAKRELALKIGAHFAFDPAEENLPQKIRDLTEENGVDLALECVGNNHAISTAMLCTRKKGRTVVVGFPMQALPFNFLELFTGERELIGACGYVGEFGMSLAMLADGRVDPKPLFSSVISLDEIVPKGFQLFESPQNTNVKIVIKTN